MSLKKGQRGPRVWRQNEDVALGFWISRAERKVSEREGAHYNSSKQQQQQQQQQQEHTAATI